MKRIICCLAVALATASLLAPVCAADDPTVTIIKRDSHAVSLDLKFSRKRPNALQRTISFLDYGPNGHATGFIVGNGLVMTAHHVVSGDLTVPKKVQLGFAPGDQLRVSIYINGCQATVVKVDEDADLALLRTCPSQKKSKAPAFQASVNENERLLLIARPHGGRTIRRGTFHGPYEFRGLQYWSAKIDTRDGDSGSPVYNDRAELVGVFSSYDWTKKLAVISPGTRAQKLLEDYAATK